MNVKKFLRVLSIGLLATGLQVGGALAAQCGNTSAGYGAWLKEFRAQAAARGIGQRARAALDQTRYAQKTIITDRNQKSFRYPLDKFMQVRGGSVIASQGKSQKRKHAQLLASIERKFGVPAGPLLAIWGMETGFGRTLGNEHTLSAVATLAYD